MGKKLHMQRKKPMPKKTNSQTKPDYLKVIENQAKEITSLHDKIEQRDTLIRMMQEDHARTVAVGNDIKTKAQTMIVQVESFIQSFQQTRAVLFTRNFVSNEADEKSKRSTFEIEQKINEIYQQNFSARNPAAAVTAPNAKHN